MEAESFHHYLFYPKVKSQPFHRLLLHRLQKQTTEYHHLQQFRGRLHQNKNLHLLIVILHLHQESKLFYFFYRQIYLNFKILDAISLKFIKDKNLPVRVIKGRLNFSLWENFLIYNHNREKD